MRSTRWRARCAHTTERCSWSATMQRSSKRSASIAIWCWSSRYIAASPSHQHRSAPVMRRILSAVVLASLFPPALGAQNAPSGPPRNIDRYVTHIMEDYEVPGLALAIVKDGKVVVARGYGVRKRGEAAKADGQTLFGIASNTKAFTATALGLLVEEGK